MDLKQLNYFLCLAREGNMTRAARQLNIVQPALSMQIAKLEKTFGKQLFDRAAHGVSLTPAGETLVLLAGTITKEVDRAKEEMARLDGKISGRVSIGMITSAAQSTLAASSAKIAAQYPEIRLLICEGYTDTLIDWVVAGELDVAIVNMPLRKIPLTAHHILDEDMMLARRTGSKMRIPKTISFKRLEGLDLVIPSRRHGLRMILDNAAAAAGFVLQPRLEIDTLSAICEIVATTEMVTVLPGIALTPLLSAGRIRAQLISRPAISRSVNWVTNPRRVVSGATAAVVEIISGDLTRAAKAASRLAGG
jgi:LysR family transcriptional regulator, nitrogen assimilation regulatory protein